MAWEGIISVLILLGICLRIYSKIKKQSFTDSIQEIIGIFKPKE